MSTLSGPQHRIVAKQVPISESACETSLKSYKPSQHHPKIHRMVDHGAPVQT
ncbi:hypothetical protein HanRHA438_Chr17g0790571 [Helianthus annuus]|nr:hypothetical protein HanRHA438_Chr17g0790571 [Helianthus annuus]